MLGQDVQEPAEALVEVGRVGRREEAGRDLAGRGAARVQVVDELRPLGRAQRHAEPARTWSITSRASRARAGAGSRRRARARRSGRSARRSRRAPCSRGRASLCTRAAPRPRPSHRPRAAGSGACRPRKRFVDRRLGHQQPGAANEAERVLHRALHEPALGLRGVEGFGLEQRGEHGREGPVPVAQQRAQFVDHVLRRRLVAEGFEDLAHDE